MMSNNFAILGSAATGAAATAYQELFDSLLDIGKDRISVNEARTVFKQLFGVNMTNADIIAAADESNNSYLTQLDKAQFCIAMHSIIKNLKEMECRSSVLHRLSEEHFDLLDCEKKGFITYPDLQRAAKTAGCQTTSDTLMQMFDMITRDDAQRITRDEFLDFF